MVQTVRVFWNVNAMSLGTVYPTTQHNISEDINLQQHRCENFKSRISSAIMSLLKWQLQFGMC
jgi:hypothetical protein